MARPSKLTPERHVSIVNQLAAGQRQHVAAELSGLTRSSLERWLVRGHEAQENARERILELDQDYRERIASLDDEPRPVPDDLTGIDLDLVTIDDDGKRSWTPIAVAMGKADGNATRMTLAFTPPADWGFLRLWVASSRARAAAEGILVARWREAATGYDATEETTVEHFDAEGQSTGRTVTTKRRRERDWRAAHALLAARHPEEYATRRKFASETDELENVTPIGTLEDEQTAGLRAIDELENLRQRKAGSE